MIAKLTYFMDGNGDADHDARMSEDVVQNTDRAYFHRRAEQELSQARRAGDPAAGRAHYHLAGYYLDIVYSAQTNETTGQCRNKAANPS